MDTLHVIILYMSNLSKLCSPRKFRYFDKHFKVPDQSVHHLHLKEKHLTTQKKKETEKLDKIDLFIAKLIGERECLEYKV